MLYINFMVTTNQKPKINTHTHTQNNKEKRIQINTKDSHQITREDCKGRKGIKENYKNNQKTINKMAVSTCLSIIK